MSSMSGIVENIIFRNTDSGYAVAKCKTEDLNEFCMVGTMPDITVDAKFKAEGSWKKDSKYGWQFNVSLWREIVPTTSRGIKDFLKSGAVAGIGPILAGRIVGRFGNQALKIIESEPERLLEIRGIGQETVNTIVNGYSKRKCMNSIILTLHEYGISTSYARKIYKTFQDASLDILRNDPYRLADEVWGIGFKTADKIALKLGIKKDSHLRLRSGVKYVLQYMGDSGDCFAQKDTLCQKGVELLDVEREKISDMTEELVENEDLIEESGNIYLPKYYYAERDAAENLARVLCGERKKEINSFNLVSDLIQNSEMTYDELQIEAIEGSLENKVFYLTGGPGTGKTTTTNAIIECFDKAGYEVMLAAPTGRAAKRMSEVANKDVSTIHRMLEFKPDGGFRKNEDNQLCGDVLIVDECSMIDILLMDALMKAVPTHMSLVFVGDVNQLPSVGAGNVLKDIIESGVIPGTELVHIFRQAEGSMIIQNAYNINRGDKLYLKNDKDSDFFFANMDDENRTAKQIIDYCTKNLVNYYKADPTTDIQILSPMRKGVCGTINLNKMFQEKVNPEGPYFENGEMKFRLRDKVMQLKNNYEKGVFNGDVGFIETLDLENRTLSVRFDEDSMIEYSETELDELALAYAITVHKSQGSEHKIVVMPLVGSHYMMLNRNLFYTGVTRAKDVFILLGSMKAISIAINKENASLRCTSLREQIRKEQIKKVC